MFSGSLRINLDPLEAHSDDEIWNALDLSFLKDFVSHLPGKLMHTCLEGGSNFRLNESTLKNLILIAFFFNTVSYAAYKYENNSSLL